MRDTTKNLPDSPVHSDDSDASGTTVVGNMSSATGSTQTDNISQPSGMFSEVSSTEANNSPPKTVLVHPEG